MAPLSGAASHLLCMENRHYNDGYTDASSVVEQHHLAAEMPIAGYYSSQKRSVMHTFGFPLLQQHTARTCVNEKVFNFDVVDVLPRNNLI